MRRFASPASRALAVFGACLCFLFAPTAHGGQTLEVDAALGADDGESPFATIQAAVAAAQAGDTIAVAAGEYEGEVVVSKPLTLEGANAGRLIDEPRETETVLADILRIAHDGVRVDGFALTGPNAGVVADPDTGASDIAIEHNLFSAVEGPAALLLAAPSVSAPQSARWTVRHNRFEDLAGEGAVAAVFVAVSDLVVEENRVVRTASALPPLGGFFIDGVSEAEIRRNYFALGQTEFSDDAAESGFALRVGMKSGPVENLLIEDNDISGARTGVILHDGAASGATLRGNRIGNVFVAVDARADSADPQFGGPQSISFLDNEFTTSANGWTLRLRDGAHAAADDLRAEGNAFAGGRLKNGVAGRAVAATRNWWGTGDWSRIPERIAGPGAGAVTHNPWYADAGRTRLVEAFNGTGGIGAGEHVTADSVVILPDSTLSVEGVLQVNGELTLAEGAVLDVVNGSLILEDGSALAGSFTVFNSFGSVFFNDDVTLTTSAGGLILAADVHVAPGANISIDGKLVIDGSVVESTGTFFFTVSATGDFTMARSVFTNGVIFSSTPELHLYDNRFVDAFVVLDAGAAGARIYHNIVGDPDSWITGSGAPDAVTEVDGWGNVADPADTENNLLIDLNITGLSNRSQDVDGNIFIQPGDPFGATIHLSALQEKIAGVEMLLGYSTQFLTADSIVYDADWDQPIVVAVDDTATVGKIDAAIGVSFSFADPEGKDADGPLAEVLLEANELVEGTTLFFQRVKLETDTFGGETRLTTGGTEPAYLTPFTGNSPSIFIDGTPPVIAYVGDHASVLQDGEDMTLVGNITLQGDLLISAAAYDAFVGIEDSAAVVTLVGPATHTSTLTGTSPGPVIGDDEYTTYNYTFAVDGTVQSGTYDVIFTVTDRSGNTTTETLGTVEIHPLEVDVSVQLQGLVAGPLSRDVTFVFTDVNGTVLEERTESVEFTGGVGSLTFLAVSADTVRLSAKTAWNLRRRLDLAFDANGIATADFTGASQLLGGDLTGNNVVGTTDFLILRNFFNQVGGSALQADITGNGAVGSIDFIILRNNFNFVGDPL